MKKLTFIACLALACGCESKASRDDQKCDQPPKCCAVEKKSEPVAIAPGTSSAIQSEK